MGREKNLQHGLLLNDIWQDVCELSVQAEIMLGAKCIARSNWTQTLKLTILSTKEYSKGILTASRWSVTIIPAQGTAETRRERSRVRLPPPSVGSQRGSLCVRTMSPKLWSQFLVGD
jgi:hypothetical protein